MKKHLFIPFSIILFTVQNLYAQSVDDLLAETKPAKEYVDYTFKTSKIISAQSTETVAKNALDFRVVHRFGDMAATGAKHTLYGFDNSSDIMIAFDYGVNDRLTLGISRNKGAGALRELYTTSVKYKALRQTKDNKTPLSITLYGNSSVSGMAAGVDSTSIDYLPKFNHRFSYVAQAIIARKFSNSFSLELLPTYVHRNYVKSYDANDLFALGVGARVKFTKRFGMVFDAFIPASKWRLDKKYREQKGIAETYQIPIGVGFEWETGGHVFHINFSNSTGILENDFIPYTNKRWDKGEFRLGFTISRVFQFKGKK